MKKKVLIADDKTMYRNVLENFLAETEFEIVGVAENGYEIIEKVERLKPDLMLLDISIPNCCGNGIFEWIGRNYPDMKIIVPTMHRQLLEKVFKSKDFESYGYCLKDCDPDLLLSGIKRILEVETFVSNS
jgi:DNA-binding NarL/FixJ family response regulator